MKLFQAIAILAFFQGVCSIPISEVQEKASQGLRLLQLGDDLEPVWKTEEEKFDLLEQNVGFVSLLNACFVPLRLMICMFPQFDVTETYELEQSLGPIIKSKLVTAAACEYRFATCCMLHWLRSPIHSPLTFAPERRHPSPRFAGHDPASDLARSSHRVQQPLLHADLRR